MGADPAEGKGGGQRTRRGSKAVWIDGGGEEGDAGVELTSEVGEGGVAGEDVLTGLNETGGLAGEFEELTKGAIGRAAVGDPGRVIEVEEERASREEGDEFFDPGGAERNGLPGDEDGVIVATFEKVLKAAQRGSEDPGDLREVAARSVEEGVVLRVKERGEVAFDAMVPQ